MINKTSEVKEPEMADEGVSQPSNVILFPGKTKNRPPQSFADICREVKLNKTARIEEITESVVVNLFEDLFGHNFDFTERTDANKEMAFLIEAVKAIMCRHDGLEHPFHAMAEQYFVADENGDITFTLEEEGSREVIHIQIDDGGGDTGC